MRLAPYRVAPAPVPVALVDAHGTAWTLNGSAVGIGTHPFAFYVHHDYVAPMLTSGRGRGTWWNAQLITWEPSPGVLVRVLPHAGAPGSFADRLLGVGLWAEYLAHRGVSLAAAPHKAPASLGSASWRLLRRTLRDVLWYAVPRAHLPPVAAVIGGRQEMGWTTPGVYPSVAGGQPQHSGRTSGTAPAGSQTRGASQSSAGDPPAAYHLWDISAAYARTLADLPYGGVWRHLDRTTARALDLPALVEAGVPCFVRARVHLSAHVGPLPRRPRGRRTYWDHLLTPVEYPRTGRMQGTWTADELLAACEAGCRAEILEGWLHFADRDARPFGPWWEAIEEARAFSGYPGLLGKITGNALLGMFAVDHGRRREQWWEDGRMQRRSLRREPSRPRAFDLFEYVAGRIRARLYREALAPGGTHILCAHTDSVWSDGFTPLGDWRLHDTAEAIDLIDPQTYAWRRPGDPVTRYVMAGVPEPDHPAEFDQRWLAEFGPNGPQRRTTAYDHVAETERATRRRKVDA